jgi:hypothetical protein
MKTKLTLSLPEKTIREVKKIAKQRNTSVSALFEQSIPLWRVTPNRNEPSGTGWENDLSDLLGSLEPQPAFDARSKFLREKHG